MSTTEEEIHLFGFLRKLFSKPRLVEKGDIGVFQDVVTVKTGNDGTHDLKYDIFLKIEVLSVFEDLVEINVIDKFVMNSSNQEINTVIDNSIPKYINKKYIKWSE
jgi:hypothetical protein